MERFPNLIFPRDTQGFPLVSLLLCRPPHKYTLISFILMKYIKCFTYVVSWKEENLNSLFQNTQA